jgi:hypothetical protein
MSFSRDPKCVFLQLEKLVLGIASGFMFKVAELSKAGIYNDPTRLPRQIPELK